MPISLDVLGEKQRLSRKEAALQQIRMAIHLFHTRDFACAITLALAAEDQLPTVDDPYLFGQIQRRLKQINKEEEIDKFNFVRNWLKHFKEPDEIDLFEFEVWIAVARAATKFVAVYHQATKDMDEFFEWSRARGYTGN